MKRLALGALLACALLLAPLTALALEVIVGLPYGDHRIGHTAVRVRAPAPHGEVIYDFGRYGKKWGYLELHGEGILRVWRGPKQVARYLQKQTSYRDSVGFTIRVSPSEERGIYDYYEKLIAGARWSKKYDRHMRYRLARDYDGVTWQCTSVALAGYKAVVPRERWERLLDPRFNQGKGFDTDTLIYYFEQQRRLGLHEVVVPLDVLLAFSFAHWAGERDLLAVRSYPIRNPRYARRQLRPKRPERPRATNSLPNPYAGAGCGVAP